MSVRTPSFFALTYFKIRAYSRFVLVLIRAKSRGHEPRVRTRVELNQILIDPPGSYRPTRVLSPQVVPVSFLCYMVTLGGYPTDLKTARVGIDRIRSGLGIFDRDHNGIEAALVGPISEDGLIDICGIYLFQFND
ncbi:hypothetical protein OPV22_006605 [Ensete ventricosum]|uniref:Uncharacterized protein n=1 Tax=Ensete ventricosum TaxID=4639 RepID=A0AAV8RNG0_ENSVE|nr:hypothetical protein OPV22_006605 [Ensete ventricosum]